jgi:hypothetical protein
MRIVRTHLVDIVGLVFHQDSQHAPEEVIEPLEIVAARGKGLKVLLHVLGHDIVPSRRLLRVPLIFVQGKRRHGRLAGVKLSGLFIRNVRQLLADGRSRRFKLIQPALDGRQIPENRNVHDKYIQVIVGHVFSLERLHLFPGVEIGKGIYLVSFKLAAGLDAPGKKVGFSSCIFVRTHWSIQFLLIIARLWCVIHLRHGPPPSVSSH